MCIKCEEIEVMRCNSIIGHQPSELSRTSLLSPMSATLSPMVSIGSLASSVSVSLHNCCLCLSVCLCRTNMVLFAKLLSNYSLNLLSSMSNSNVNLLLVFVGNDCNITAANPSSTKYKRPNRPCPFCGITQVHLSRHITRQHADEESVANCYERS